MIAATDAGRGKFHTVSSPHSNKKFRPNIVHSEFTSTTPGCPAHPPSSPHTAAASCPNYVDVFRVLARKAGKPHYAGAPRISVRRSLKNLPAVRSRFIIHDDFRYCTYLAQLITGDKPADVFSAASSARRNHRFRV